MNHASHSSPATMARCSLWVFGLATVLSTGCALAGSTRARLGVRTAASLTAVQPSTSTSEIAAPEGIVDLSEPPVVVEAPVVGGLDPGVLLAPTQVTSWVHVEHSGQTLELELRNNCSRDFAYAFADTEAADSQELRRTIAGNSLELERISAGQWLHLWDGDRWLGSATTTFRDGRMDISPTCDHLVISHDEVEHGQFAIHWELDADDGLMPVMSASEVSELTLAVVEQDPSQVWGPEQAETRVELRLANFCAESIDYAFTSSLDGTPEQTASLAGYSEHRVEIPAGWWLRFRVIDDAWRGGATTSLDDAVMWIDGNCVDFGVADEKAVSP